MDRTTDAPAEWLSFDDACEHAKCSRNTIHRWMNDGAISSRKFGPRRYIDRATLDDYLDRRSRKTTYTATLKERELDDYVARLVAAAPALSERQRGVLKALVA